MEKYMLELEMGDEIFTFGSFINFMIFLNISRPLFEIFIEVLYFNNNVLIIRQKCRSSLAKGE